MDARFKETAPPRCRSEQYLARCLAEIKLAWGICDAVGWLLQGLPDAIDSLQRVVSSLNKLGGGRGGGKAVWAVGCGLWAVGQVRKAQ